MIDAISLSLSNLWVPRLGVVPVPIVALALSAILLFKSPSIRFNSLFLPFLSLILVVVVYVYHLDAPDVNLLESFFRLVFPFLFSLISAARLSGVPLDKVRFILYRFIDLVALLVLIDFSPFLSMPYSAFFSLLDPYSIKDKTLLFYDSNWSGYFLCICDVLGGIYSIKRSMLSKRLVPALVLISGSRSCFIYFLVSWSVGPFRSLCTRFPLHKFLRFHTLKLLSSRKFLHSFAALTLMGAALIYPYYQYIIVQSGEFLKPANTASISIEDGSFQTKMQIVDYSIRAISDTRTLLFGNGPKIVAVDSSYTGHSLVGQLPEYGLLGMAPFVLPFLFLSPVTIDNAFRLAMILLVSSTSFFPMAFMAPYYSFLFIFSGFNHCGSGRAAS